MVPAAFFFHGALVVRGGGDGNVGLGSGLDVDAVVVVCGEPVVCGQGPRRRRCSGGVKFVVVCGKWVAGKTEWRGGPAG